MLEKVKARCGIAEEITVYDEQLQEYIADALADMAASGVPEELLENEEDPQVMTAVSCYVKAYLGDDRADTEKYLDLYRKKVFRLTLEGEYVE